MKFPGVELELGGCKRVLPPITAGIYKQYKAEIESCLAGGAPPLDQVAKWTHACLERNYPDVTLEQVEGWVDFGNYIPIFEALMNISGLQAQLGNMMRRLVEGSQAPT